VKDFEKIRETLPLDDETIAALDPATRSLLGRQWEDRARAEVRTAAAFAKVSYELLRCGASPQVLESAGRAVSDELGHVEVCRLAASAYYGREARWPEPGIAQLPSYRDAPRRLRPTLDLVGMCCMSETIAVAWLEAGLKDARSPLARAAIRILMADDVRHARLGWMHLASMKAEPLLAQTISQRLVPILDSVLRPWLRSAAESFPPGVPEHGVPSAATTERVVLEAVNEVVLPGFDLLEIDTAPVREWLLRRSI
jgi:hypothetical protein